MKSFSVALPEGIWYMLSANLFFSFMTVSVYGVKILDPSVSPFVVSFVRVIVNFLVILLPVIVFGKRKLLFGDRRASLWFRGLFGGIALMLFFYSIQTLGPSESTFIQSANGIFIVLLCPLVLSERFSVRALLAVLGAVLGLYILFDPSFSGGRTIGQIMALVSGVFAALSALMVAKSGKSNSYVTVVFYFCFVAVFVHLAYFAVAGDVVIPKGYLVWVAMIGVGIFSSAAQLLMTKAYQIAPASVVVAVGYSGPVLNTVWGIVLFGQMLTIRAMVGCFIILLCGVFLPFLKKELKTDCPVVDIKEGM